MQKVSIQTFLIKTRFSMMNIREVLYHTDGKTEF